MNALFARLQDVHEAGAYRLNCAPDELHAVAAQAGCTLFEADLAEVHGKGEFLAAVAQALKAPEWFGNNWDALADALGDLSWSNSAGPPAAGYVLLLHNGDDTLGLGEAEHKIVTAIFTDAVNFWKTQGKPFWIFFC